MKIFMVSIPVEDPAKAHKIYTTKLGFVSKDINSELHKFKKMELSI